MLGLLECERNQMPYLLSRLSSPFLPTPVCLIPSIANNVPSGRVTRVSGINVTLVWLPITLVSVTPCLVCLPTFHSSLWRSLISCLPVIAGSVVYLGNGSQLSDRLNIWPNKAFCIDNRVNSNSCFGFGKMKYYMVFLKKMLSFPYIFKGIQMEQYRFFYPSIRFCKRTPKGCCAKFFTIGSPSLTFSLKCESQHYISSIHNNLLHRIRAILLSLNELSLTIVNTVVDIVNNYFSRVLLTHS